MTGRLDHALARARAAVLGQVLDSTCGSGGLPISAPTLPAHREMSPPRDLTELSVPPLSIHGPFAAPLVMVRNKNRPPPPSAPSWPSCEDVLTGHALRTGAAEVFAVLHRLALDVGRARGYTATPDTVVLHLPASLLCLGVGISRATLYRRLPELVEAGLLAHGGQAQKVRDMGLYGGCLWAIKVSVGEIVPRIRREDWKHQYREFAADIDSGRTVKALVDDLRQLHPQNREKVVQDALKSWTLIPGNISSPLPVVVSRSGVGLDAAQDIREVSYRLGELLTVHPDHRAELVGRTASTLARLLDDSGSRRWYCKLLWEAFRSEQEGRGGLGALGAALARLDADRAEWTGLRNPAALLVTRLRVV